MYSKIKYNEWRILDSLSVKIPSVFALTVVCGRFSSKLAFQKIFSHNLDHIKPTLGQFIFVHLVWHPGISSTTFSKPGSPGSKVGSTLVIKTCNGIVPRPFPNH